MKQFGENWQKVSEVLIDRTPAQIRSRYRRMLSKMKEGEATDGEDLDASTAADGADEVQQQQQLQAAIGPAGTVSYSPLVSGGTLVPPTTNSTAPLASTLLNPLTSLSSSTAAITSPIAYASTTSSSSAASSRPTIASLPHSPTRQKRPAAGEAAESPQPKRTKGRTPHDEASSSSTTATSAYSSTLQSKYGWARVASASSSSPSTVTPSATNADGPNVLSSRSNSPIHRPRDVPSSSSSSDGNKDSHQLFRSSGLGIVGIAATGVDGDAQTSSSKGGRLSLSPDEVQRQIDAAVNAALAERSVVSMRREEEWAYQLSQLKSQIEALNRELIAKDVSFVSKERVRMEMLEHASGELLVSLKESEMRMRSAVREKLAQDSARLGYPAFGRNGEEFREGVAAKVLREKEAKLEEQRAAYETTKKRLAKRKASLSVTNALSSTSSTSASSSVVSAVSLSSSTAPYVTSPNAMITSTSDLPLSPNSITSSNINNVSTIGDASSSNNASSGAFGRQLLLRSASTTSSLSSSPFGQQQAISSPEKELEDIIMQEHLIKLKLASLKSDEQELVREREALRVETQLHYKELRRFQEEEMSKFNAFPVLHERYLMLQLLGRGGFSEVYRAYDLTDFRYVACKIHQLGSNWAAEKKASYLRHAQRECDIHKALVHPRIVSMYDVFEIDEDTFCTVMEYCQGGDLDSYLKQHKSLPEIEARVLIAQLFDGLRYLMSREKDKQKIIHYDLKPGNLLFDENGSLKIADFGLSKIMEGDSDSMELTSQGAGTYWYLPPECFDPDKPKISGKVDVWSAGVILYQMLFGCKPFGHNISQKHILERNLIHSNLKVEFPATKKVSEEAKNFLIKCLTANVIQRPDALELAQDPFLIFVQPKKTGTGISTSAAPGSPGGGRTMGPPSTTAPIHISTLPHVSTTIGGGTLTFIRKK